jgi:hypothetical protein
MEGSCKYFKQLYAAKNRQSSSLGATQVCQPLNMTVRQLTCYEMLHKAPDLERLLYWPNQQKIYMFLNKEGVRM